MTVVTKNNMNCADCVIDSIERVLRLDTEIYEDSHDFANVMQCESCSRVFLEYWVEIFDDGWKYWVEIDESERARISTSPSPKNEVVKVIKNKEVVFCKDPSGKFKIATGVNCLLDGPPW